MRRLELVPPTEEASPSRLALVGIRAAGLGVTTLSMAVRLRAVKDRNEQAISNIDLSRWPVMGSLARELGVIFVSRGDPHSGVRVMRCVAEALGHGIPVPNFPEGTTTRGDGVLPFRKGLFGLACATRARVVPIALAYGPPELAWVGRDAFLPHWVAVAARRRARASVRIGPAIAPGDHGGAAALADVARGAVVELLREAR